MKYFICSLLALLSLLPSLRAGSETILATTRETATGEKIPLTIFSIDSGYVFESDIENGDDDDNRLFGEQDAFNIEFEFTQRILLRGNWYLHLGAAYERFEFGDDTFAPVPDHLQLFAGVIGIDYMRGDDLGGFLHIKPGFYTQDDIGSSSFDAPITLARFWILQPDKLYLFTGVNASFLRGQLPVLPLLGLVWVPNEKFRVMGLVPEPRVIYSATDELEFWLGGQLLGGSFRTDRNERIVPRKLSGAQVDYTDYRAGLGFSYTPCRYFSVDVGGGYSFQRKFDFNRAGEEFHSDPAPFVRVELKALF